jgi:hypothetical protein
MVAVLRPHIEEPVSPNKPTRLKDWKLSNSKFAILKRVEVGKWSRESIHKASKE